MRIKDKDAIFLAKLYETFGYSAFTANEVWEKLGEYRFRGFVIRSYINNKNIVRVDREWINASHHLVGTYKLTKQTILYLMDKGYIKEEPVATNEFPDIENIIHATESR